MIEYLKDILAAENKILESYKIDQIGPLPFNSLTSYHQGRRDAYEMLLGIYEEEHAPAHKCELCACNHSRGNQCLM